MKKSGKIKHINNDILGDPLKFEFQNVFMVKTIFRIICNNIFLDTFSSYFYFRINDKIWTMKKPIISSYNSRIVRFFEKPAKVLLVKKKKNCSGNKEYERAKHSGRGQTSHKSREDNIEKGSLPLGPWRVHTLVKKTTSFCNHG